jgi:hypothetical protein
VRPATTLAPALSPLEADAAAQLAPVRRIERSQLRADWHCYAVSWITAAFDASGGHRTLWWASVTGGLHASSPWPLPCALVSTRADSSVFIPALPHHAAFS